MNFYQIGNSSHSSVPRLQAPIWRPGMAAASGTGSFNQTATIDPSGTPPEAPDMSELLAAYANVPQIFNPNRVRKTYNAQIEASKATTTQQGRNAGLGYANRLMQAGIAPVATGVVEAVARRPGMENTRALMSESEKYALETRKEGAAMTTQIANALASLRNDYTKTLADFNARQASLKVQTNATAAQTGLGYARLDQERDLAEEAARIAASAGAGVNETGGTGDYFPGYITNTGPIIPGYGYDQANGHNVFMGMPGMTTASSRKRLAALKS